MRTTATLQQTVLDHARTEAGRLGITVSEVIENALRRQLVERPQVAAPPFTLHTVRGGLVTPDIDLDRTSALLTQDDETEYSER